jgi:hypothetical protein
MKKGKAPEFLTVMRCALGQPLGFLLCERLGPLVFQLFLLRILLLSTESILTFTTQDVTTL